MPRQTPYVDTAYFDMPQGTKATPLGGGRNSQVFLLEPPGRDPMVFKRYFVDPRDKRDRQGAEAKALRFLEKSGVDEAPLLLTLDTDRQVSMLSFVEGGKVVDPTLEDMDRSAAFLVRLIRLSKTEEAVKSDFGSASEAFFSASGVLENIELRFARLKGVEDTCPLCAEFTDFFENRLRPSFENHTRSCASSLEAASMSLDEEIPEAWRILSPSDFGTHNAVRRPDGSLAFFDYEYFGWDDPSKMLSDFCLHPGMGLDEKRRYRFLQGVLSELDSLGYNRERAKAMFPLLGIKWCCILLNEFVPREAARRNFARQERSEGHTRVLSRQLDKARSMLAALDDRASEFSRHLATI